MDAILNTDSSIRQSRVGKRPVDLPAGVQISTKGDSLEIKGPKGSLTKVIPSSLKIEIKDQKLYVIPLSASRDSARVQGMFRALVSTAVVGVSQGYLRELELVGTGYRAEMKNAMLQLSLGFSHLVLIPVSKSISVQVPSDSKGTRILLESCDKAVVGQLAANLRSLRPPEPYGGKGVRYKGQKIRQKAGKSGGKGK